eukprot:gene18081-19888_t
MEVIIGYATGFYTVRDQSDPVFRLLAAHDSESNLQLVDALSKAEQRQIVHGEDPTAIEEAPSFATHDDQIKWKLNKAKKTLHKARQLESLARKAAVHFGYFDNMKTKHSVVSDLLSSTEDTLLEAGDKMGFDYQKF